MKYYTFPLLIIALCMFEALCIDALLDLGRNFPFAWGALATATPGAILAYLLAKRFFAARESLLEAKIKLLSEQLLKSQALSDAALMSAGSVKDLNMYMGALEGTNYMINENKQRKESMSAAIKLQKKCISQARQSISRLMWFIKKGSKLQGHARPINDVLYDAVELAKLLVEEKKLKIRTNFCALPPDLFLDDIALMHAVISIVKLASEEAAYGSEITLISLLDSSGGSHVLTLSLKNSELALRADDSDSGVRQLSSILAERAIQEINGELRKLRDEAENRVYIPLPGGLTS